MRIREFEPSAPIIRSAVRRLPVERRTDGRGEVNVCHSETVEDADAVGHSGGTEDVF